MCGHDARTTRFESAPENPGRFLLMQANCSACLPDDRPVDARPVIHAAIASGPGSSGKEKSVLLILSDRASIRPRWSMRGPDSKTKKRRVCPYRFGGSSGQGEAI